MKQHNQKHEEVFKQQYDKCSSIHNHKHENKNCILTLHRHQTPEVLSIIKA